MREILNVYGRKVAAGEWRDYAIDFTRDKAVFSVFRRTTETPLYRIEKDPRAARRQGAFSVVAGTGRVMKRGHELSARSHRCSKKEFAGGGLNRVPDSPIPCHVIQLAAHSGGSPIDPVIARRALPFSSQQAVVLTSLPLCGRRGAPEAPPAAAERQVIESEQQQDGRDVTGPARPDRPFRASTPCSDPPPASEPPPPCTIFSIATV